jgi:micrococcal nuclease
VRPQATVVVLVVLVAGAGCLGPAGDQSTESTVGTVSGPTLSPGSGVDATVVRVVDGDTVVVELPNGSEEKVRLIGVDTPEVFSDNDPAEYGVVNTTVGRKCLDDWGDRATAFAKDRLAGESVRLTFDENLPRRGYYGRLLAYVSHENRSFNHHLIATGHARVFRSEFVLRPEYETTQRRARSAGRGLWACADDPAATTDRRTPTPAGTVADAGLELVEVHADAPGNDNENPNGEYVTFENRGEDPIDLSGWRVRDEAGHTYRFSRGTVLDPGDRITLRTGSGSDGEGVRYWGQSGAVWNNGGDVVTVVDDEGRVVLREKY